MWSGEATESEHGYQQAKGEGEGASREGDQVARNSFETDLNMVHKILKPDVLHTQFHSAAKIAGTNPVEWMENADRWIVGFLEKFEEGCHMMVSMSQGIHKWSLNSRGNLWSWTVYYLLLLIGQETAIKDRIQEGLKRQGRSESNLCGEDSEDSN